MKIYNIFILALIFTVFFGCGENANLDLPTENLDAESLAFIDNAIAELEADEDQPPSEEASNRSVVYVKAGSKDALADAIAEAGVGGKVMFKSGTHYLSQTVTVTHCVRIEGESGAIIMTSIPVSNVFTPAIYVNGAVSFQIKNLEFKSKEGTFGNTAIVLDEAHFARLEGLTLAGYQGGISLGFDNIFLGKKQFHFG